MTALEITYLFSEIMGLIAGIFCVATLINFLIKRAIKRESLKQKYFATLLSTTAYAVLPIWIKNLTDPYDIAGQIIFSCVLGCIVCSFMRKTLSLKKFMLFELFGFMGFMGLGIIWLMLLGDNYRSIIGTIDFVVSFVISGMIIFKKDKAVSR